MLKVLRRLVVLSVLVAIAVAVYRKLGSAQSSGPWDEAVTTPPLAATPPVAKPPGAPSATWIEPEAGSCPSSHPIKAKLSSGIFHSPGGLSYERTNADRCYVDTDAATADGLRAAQR